MPKAAVVAGFASLLIAISRLSRLAGTAAGSAQTR
jgi:hypothetical protein